MDFRQIEYFAAVAQAGSFLKASRDLGLTQPALSRQVALLERELKVQLFERGRSGVRPTPEGGRLLQRATELLDLWTDTQSSLKGKGQLETKYTICAGGTMSAYVLPRILAAIRKRHGVSFRVIEGDALQTAELLDSGKADLGIVSGDPGGGLLSREFLTDEIVPVTSRADPMAKRRPRLEEMLKREFVLYHPASAIRALLEQRVRTVAPGRTLNGVMELRSVESVLNCAAAGLGVGFASRLSLPKSVRELRSPELTFQRKFFFAYRPTRPATALLIRAIEEQSGFSVT
ncbi:MAG: LysR family transcriptional regulator [Spirochaetia bacterium]|nr:LysR family transcriptional regulator [Spirochaetia bacterium]